MGAFPKLSRNVPFCPRLSSFVLLGIQNGDKSGQKGANGDSSGQIGKRLAFTPINLGALKGTELRWRRKPKRQIFAENGRFSQIHPFSWKFKHLEGAGNCRKPCRFSQKSEDFRRKPQIGPRHLRCVTFSSALIKLFSIIFLRLWSFLLACSVQFVRWRFWAISKESRACK